MTAELPLKFFRAPPSWRQKQQQQPGGPLQPPKTIRPNMRKRMTTTMITKSTITNTKDVAGPRDRPP